MVRFPARPPDTAFPLASATIVPVPGILVETGTTLMRTVTGLTDAIEISTGFPLTSTCWNRIRVEANPANAWPAVFRISRRVYMTGIAISGMYVHGVYITREGIWLSLDENGHQQRNISNDECGPRGRQLPARV